MNRLLARHDAPPIDADTVANLLGKYLLRQESHGTERYWVVTEKWLDPYLKQYDRNKPNIRIA